MSEQVFNAGDEIDSYCTTCKIVLAHQVYALVDGVVDKVICKTCGKKHKYRPNPPKSRTKAAGKKAAGEKKRTTRTRRTKDPSVLWEETFAGKDLSQSKPYSISGVFQEKDIIDHKTFGPGFVTQILGEGKMEVIFKGGTKILVCERK